MGMNLTHIHEPEAPRKYDVSPHHGALSVPDLEASIAWYRKYFGFAVEIRFEMPEAGLTGAFIRSGAMRIELFELAGAKPMPAERASVPDDLATHGMKHFAMQVQDAGAVYEYCQEQGFEIALPLMKVGGTTAFYIRDNSGILIEFCEPFAEVGCKETQSGGVSPAVQKGAHA